MAYKLTILPCWDDEGSILELEYQGDVPFSERSRALDDMSAVLTTTTIRRIFVDFSQAHLRGSTDDGERVDFLSKSITAPGFDGCRVAMLGLKKEDSRTIDTTAHMRDLDARQFSLRKDALDWLCGGAQRPQFIS